MEEGWERRPRVRLTQAEVNHLVEAAFPGRSIGSIAEFPTGLVSSQLTFLDEEIERPRVVQENIRIVDETIRMFSR